MLLGRVLRLVSTMCIVKILANVMQMAADFYDLF